MKKLKYIALVLIFAIAWKTYNTLHDGGYFLEIKPINTQNEKILPSPAGVEDLTKNEKSGLLYLSAHDRRHPKSVGDLYLINPKDTSLQWKNLTQGLQLQDFRPHGISIVHTPDHHSYLFAISHGDTKNEVLRFEIVKDSLVLQNKYSSTEFISPNDILAVGSQQFFLTNDHTRPKDWLRTIGDFIRFPSGNVVYFDGQKARIVTDGIAYPNGINISANKEKIYVAATSTNKLMVFEPDIQTMKLELKGEFKTAFPPDNIEVSPQGTLLIGCHPKLLDFLSHSKNEKIKSASAVIEMVPKDGDISNFSQKIIYLNTGHSLSGSSVATTFGKESILIGSVFEKKILIVFPK
jgi:arylesterase / paraoxonase